MTNRGFTLIETLVAVSVLTIAIVGPMTAASRTLIAAYTARDQMIASYLAQEGIEYVRLMRDTMYLADYAANPTDAMLPTDAFCDFTDANPASDCSIQPANVGASIAACLGAGDGTTGCALLDPLAPMNTSASALTNALYQCSSGTCPIQGRLSLSSGRYVYTGNNFTPFTRYLQFYTVGSEIEVVSVVSWSRNGTIYSTKSIGYLSPWE